MSRDEKAAVGVLLLLLLIRCRRAKGAAPSAPTPSTPLTPGGGSFSGSGATGTW